MRILPILLCAALLAGCTSSSDMAGGSSGTTAIESGSNRVTIGVNTYLWTATLNTLSFMPLASADPLGGVIITDWYSAPATPNERLKITVYILDRNLRADGLKLAVFRQTRATPTSEWAYADVNPDMAVKLENAILTRARELRLASQSGT